VQASAADYALTYVTTLKLQLVTWTVVGLTAAKFKQLILLIAWLLVVQCHVHFDLDAVGLLLSVSCVIWLYNSSQLPTAASGQTEHKTSLPTVSSLSLPSNGCLRQSSCHNIMRKLSDLVMLYNLVHSLFVNMKCNEHN
jgi:hypothetical protein